MTPQEYNEKVDEAFGKGDYETAHRLASDMYKDGTPLGAYYMALASNMQDKYSQALNEIEQYLAKEDTAQGWSAQGQIHLNGDNYYEAMKSFGKAVEKGDNNALGYEALCKFIYAKDHMNDDPNNAKTSQAIFGLMEEAIVDAATCIQKNPADFDFYNSLPSMLYTDYSMIIAGRTFSTRITTTTTKKDEFGNVLSKDVDSYETSGSWSASGNLWDLHDSIKQGEAMIQSNAAAAFKRAMHLANILDDCGRKADAAMARFEMIYSEITLNGQRGIAQDAVWFYQYGLHMAITTMGADEASSWINDYSSVYSDYNEIVRKFGNQIKRAQETGQQPNFIRYYLEESRIPTDVPDLLRSAVANADVKALGSESTKVDFRSIISGVASADLLALAPTVGAGLIANISRGYGAFVAWTFFIFAAIIFIVGLTKSSAKIPADGERKNHQLGQICLFVVFLINFWLGLIALVVCKFLPLKKA